MGDLEDAADVVKTAEKEGRLRQWALQLSEDARLALSLLPFGGHVRLRPSANAEPEVNPFNAPAAPPPNNNFAWTHTWGPEAFDESIEGFTLEADHLIKFLRASGAGRQESKDRVTSCLTELMLRGLVKVFQDEVEAPRYALTEEGLKVQQALA